VNPIFKAEDKPSKKSARSRQQSWYLVSFILWPRRWRPYVPPKLRFTFNGIHGDISPKKNSAENFVTEIPIYFEVVLVKQQFNKIWRDNYFKGNRI
jgi:hypothetical protein